MKVLVVYSSVDPQSVAGAMIAKIKYTDVTLKDIYGITTSNITNWIGTLSAVYDLILINYTVTTAGTGVLSVAQVLLLDAKIDRTVVQNGTASAGASDNTLTQAGAGWTINAYVGMYVKTTGGTGLNQVRQIVTNSATVLTLDSVWGVSISTNTTFDICASRDNFSHTIAATSGQKKRAILAWEHEKLFYGENPPLIIFVLAGDKTTASTSVNAQSVLNEGYATMACKYGLRDLTSDTIVREWKALLGSNSMQTYQDVEHYNLMMMFGQRLKESKTAFSES